MILCIFVYKFFKFISMKPFYAFYDSSYSYVRAIITLVIGLAMVIWPNQVSKYIVIIIGALLLVTGVVSVIVSNTGERKNQKTSLLSINSLVDIVFGLILVIFPNFFKSLLTFLFGILLIFFGGGQIVCLAKARKNVMFSWTFFIWPIITTACGVIMFFQPHDASNWIFIFFGAALLIYSLTEFLSTYKIRSLFKNAAENQQADPAQNGISVEEVTTEEVKSKTGKTT